MAGVHDALAPGEILLCEHLGFCKPGEGGRLIDEGRRENIEDLPLNPSGWLGALAHSISATGSGAGCGDCVAIERRRRRGANE